MDFIKLCKTWIKIDVHLKKVLSAGQNKSGAIILEGGNVFYQREPRSSEAWCETMSAFEDIGMRITVATVVEHSD